MWKRISSSTCHQTKIYIHVWVYKDVHACVGLSVCISIWGTGITKAKQYATAKCQSCYARLTNNLLSKPKHYAAICNNQMSYYDVMQIGKYLWSKPQQVHIIWILKLAIYEIEILCNTKIWVTPRCPSHRCLMRRDTPLTRSWFMPALNTQRFATVLTHPLTCFSHAEYHYCVTFYQSDVKSELQSVCKENLKISGFTLFSLTHTSIDML